MVFVIQGLQNNDTAALQIKFDELILVTTGARQELLDLEELDAKELYRIRREYEAIAKQARKELNARRLAGEVGL